MNLIKKLFAAVLAVAMVFSIAGCHKKDEIAVTVGDVEFTSAYYMCALVFADSEAKTIVDENLSEEESKEEVDYYSQKVEKKDYVDWVKDKALESLKTIAAYKIKCKEAKIDLEDDVKANAEMYASYYWSSYGYQALLEPNGVSQATYTKYMLDSYYSNRYFEFVYGKGGEKEIAADKVKDKMYENFEIADVLEVSFSEKKDDEIKSLTTKFNGYFKDLKDGKKTFEQVYNEYNNVKEEDKKEEDKESEELAPLDELATLLGSKDTDYASDHFETVQKMKTNEVKLVELDEKAGLVILVKKDIKADPYYTENLDVVARHLIADEEYEKDMETYIKGLKLEENTYATKRFKVKKIEYPEATA